MINELSTGQMIGDYEVLGILGAGGMGKVYRVRNMISGRVEAMKVLLENLQAEPDIADRFLREIRISASLDHPNIAAMRTALRVDNRLMMIMEFVDGTTLDTLMKIGKLPLAKVINYLCQALSALSYAHSQGVIHRDIKPANMMLTLEGKLKLMDFGIAKVTNDRRLTETGMMVGSVYYMSPEQIECRDLDARADLYSLGVTLYEMATGRRPFDGANTYEIMAAHLKELPRCPREFDGSLPPGLDEIVMLALAKNPALRYQAADTFRDALSSLGAADGRQMQAATPSSQTPNSLWYVLAGSAATIAVLIAGGIEIPKYMHARAQGNPAAAHLSQLVIRPLRKTDDQMLQAVGIQRMTPPGKEPADRQPVRRAQAGAQPMMSPQPPQTMPPQATPAADAELTRLRERLSLITRRAAPVRSSLQSMRQQLAAYGFGLRPDLAEAEQTMSYQLDQAELGLRRGDVAAAKERLDAADRKLEIIEDSLGISPTR